MLLRRTLPLLGIMMILAGCFRQAEDTFDTIGSQNSDEVTITQDVPTDIPTATSEITVIDPNASDTPDTSAQAIEASATPRIVSPTEAEALPTNTSSLIPTATTVVASSTPQVIPTATEPTFITPDVNEQLAIPTASPTAVVTQSSLPATPTAIGGETVAGDCEYQIQNGDNLFRIALNNNVSLAALLAENGLTEASVIQPGQFLTLPNCEAGASVETEDEEPVATSTLIVLDDCEYEIETGDTLFSIALDYGLTLAAILAENELTENAIIQPGQIITIPNCEDEDTTDSGDAEVEITEEADTGETIHTVAAGDTLLSIAREYGVTVNSILQANTIPNPNSLTVGQQLVIPDPEE